MSRITKEVQDKAVKTLAQPNIIIEDCDYTEYLMKKGTKYYKINDTTTPGSPLIEFSIIPAWRNISRYEMQIDNKKYSYLVRPRAVFHTTGAHRMMDVYNMLQIRLLGQKSKRESR